MKSTASKSILAFCGIFTLLIGCKIPSRFANNDYPAIDSTNSSIEPKITAVNESLNGVDNSPSIQLASYLQSSEDADQEVNETDQESNDEVAPSRVPSELGVTSPSEEAPPVNAAVSAQTPLLIDDILRSTLDFYPEIQEVFLLDEIATGERIAALGNFDTKFKAVSENTPVGFYETYRNSLGVELPTFQGGSLFGGYRQGRGDLEPWYLERNTNAGGEFKFGANVALLRGRDIDQRRVELWQANWRQRAVEPSIQNALIEARFFAEATYWNWVASGQLYRLNERIFKVAESRQEGIVERIEAEDLAGIAETDNERTIVSRRAKLIESRGKLEQAAAKLSLFYRNEDGLPLIAGNELLPEFPEVDFELANPIETLIAEAIRRRPDLQLIDIDIERVKIDLAKANNDLLPRFDFQIAASQDLGRPTSASAAASSSGAVFANFDEKDEFQFDASLFVNQDLQRRKARGKIRALCGKKNQLDIKKSFLVDKISAEIEQAYAGFVAAIEQAKQAKRGQDLARQLSDAARTLNLEGDVDLFELILREQQEITAGTQYIEALLNLFVSKAALNAAMGIAFESMSNVDAAEQSP